MLLDIFSSLDYCFSNFSVCKGFSLSWLVVLVLFFFFLGTKSSVKVNGLFGSGFFSGVWLRSKKGVKGVFMVMSSMFFLLIFQKVLGLFPYTFSISSHMVFNFVLALELWLIMVIYGFMSKLLQFLGHFSPYGSPLVLSKFLKLMEIVSVCMRSFTLSLRLSVNISTGHIFLSLVSSWLLMCGAVSMWSLSFFCFVSYYFFELFVCFIQALVFKLLLVQYLDEV